MRRPPPSNDIRYHRAGSAGSMLGSDDVRAAADRFAGARWLHVTGITPALSELARSAVDAAIVLGREHGLTVSIDVNMRRRLWSEPEARAALEGLDLADALAWGNAAGAAVVGSVGDQTSLPARRELDAILAGGTDAVR